MEYLTSIKIPSRNETFFGTPARTFIQQGMRVQADGKVKGLFYYVTGYERFGGPTVQNGYYFPFIIAGTGEKMELIINGKTQWADVDFDPKIILRIKPDTIAELKVDGRTVARLDFSQAKYEAPKGESKMKANFFDPGICGLMTSGYIGTFDKNTKSQTEGVTFENALPVGARMVYLIAICSDDMTGAATVTAGDGGSKEDVYAKAHAIKQGEGGASHPAMPIIKDGTIKIKVDSAVTEGTIDFYATVIRLEV